METQAMMKRAAISQKLLPENRRSDEANVSCFALRAMAISRAYRRRGTTEQLRDSVPFRTLLHETELPAILDMKWLVQAFLSMRETVSRPL